VAYAKKRLADFDLKAWEKEMDEFRSLTSQENSEKMTSAFPTPMRRRYRKYYR
jgi:hypothetical protein